MAQLKTSVRAVVRLAFGQGLPRGNRQDAVQSYLRAVELSPQKLMNRYLENCLLHAHKRKALLPSHSESSGQHSLKRACHLVYIKVAAGSSLAEHISNWGSRKMLEESWN